MIYLFVDTNIFIHCKDFDQIKWSEKFGSDQITLVVVPAIMRELDKHKGDPNNRRRRDRARKAASLIKEAAQNSTGKTVTKQAVFVVFPTEPPATFVEKLLLDPTEADDRLVASTRAWADDHPTDRTIVFSDDSGPYTKGLFCKLEVLEPLNTWMLPDEDDEATKELKQLRAEKNARPTLEIAFDGGSDVVEALIRPGFPEDAIVRRAMKAVQKQTKKIQGVSLADIVINSTAPDEIDKFNKQVESYWMAAEKWFLGWALATQRVSRTFAISFVLDNSGRATANHIKAVLEFGAGEYSITRDPAAVLQDLGKFPSAPKKPNLSAHMNHASWSPPVRPTAAQIAATPFVQALQHEPVKTTLSGRTVTFNADRLQHGESEIIGPFYIEFADFSTAAGLSIECKLKADEVTENATTLNIKLVKAVSAIEPWHALDETMTAFGLDATQ